LKTTIKNGFQERLSFKEKRKEENMI